MFSAIGRSVPNFAGNTHSPAPARLRAAANASMAPGLSGTICGRGSFMRAAGMCHSSPEEVNSDQRAPTASPGRTAARARSDCEAHRCGRRHSIDLSQHRAGLLDAGGMRMVPPRWQWRDLFGNRQRWVDQVRILMLVKRQSEIEDVFEGGANSAGNVD